MNTCQRYLRKISCRLSIINAILFTFIMMLYPITTLASLIGDTIEILQYFPDSSTPIASIGGPIIVEEGDADEVEETAQDIFFNADATSLHVFFDPANGPIEWISADFNGFGFVDLDWTDNPMAMITGVAVDASVAGFTADRVTFDEHKVLINLASLTHTGGMINIDLTHTTSSVNESSTFILATMGIAIFLVIAWRRRTTSTNNIKI